MMRGLLGGAVALGAVIALLAPTSCAQTPSPERVTEVLLPDFQTYADNVDAYLQRRCGTLDCHGQPGRAYRLYGFSGFRLIDDADGGLVSGQQPTTAAEVLANFQAAVGLEPEQMSRVVAQQGQDPNRLLLLRKPLRLSNGHGGVERHKGGPAMSEDDDGYRCVTGWLQVRTVVEGDDGEPLILDESQRTKMTAAQIESCERAKANP